MESAMVDRQRECWRKFPVDPLWANPAESVTRPRRADRGVCFVVGVTSTGRQLLGCGVR